MEDWLTCQVGERKEMAIAKPSRGGGERGRASRKRTGESYGFERIRVRENGERGMDEGKWRTWYG